MSKKKKNTAPAKKAAVKTAIAKKMPAAKAPVKKRAPSPLKQVSVLSKDRSRLNSMLYRRRRKFESVTKKGEADRLRREIRQLERQRDKITDKVSNLRQVAVRFDELRGEKKKIKSRQRRIDQALLKLYESGGIGTEQYRKLNNEHLRLSEDIHQINQELGIEEKLPSYTDEEKEEIFDQLEEEMERTQVTPGKRKKKFDWELAPDTPHTIWEAMRHLDEALSNSTFDIYVIDGEEFDSSDIVGIRFTASNFWRVQKAAKTRTPLIEISYDLEKNAVQYKPLEGF